MKIYKSIFRVDFPLNYSLLDRLGEEFQFMKDSTKGIEIDKVEGNVDILKHVIVLQGEINGRDSFKANQTLKSFDFVIEYGSSVSLDEVASHDIFEFAEKHVARISDSCDDTFDRIGFRSWILVEDPFFKFDTIKDVIVKSNSAFCKSIANKYGNIADIGLVIEAQNEQEGRIKVSMGPYARQEWPKFFSKEVDLNEGLILDIDASLHKIKMPKFKVKQFIRNFRNTCSDVVGEIVKNLHGELQ